MGLVKNAKVSSASEHARRAVAEGHSVFVYKFGMLMTGLGYASFGARRRRGR